MKTRIRTNKTIGMKKKMMALSVGALVIGSAGLVAAKEQPTTTSINDFEETNYDYGTDVDFKADYDFDAEEEKLWEEMDQLFEKHEAEYTVMEEALEKMYEEIDVAFEANNDADILRLAKAIYAKENEFEAFEEKIGMTKLYEKFEQYEGDEWAEYEDFDGEDFDYDAYDEMWDKVESSDDPKVKEQVAEMEKLEAEAEKIEKQHMKDFQELDDKAEKLFDDLVEAEQKENNSENVEKIEKQLDSLEQEYIALEEKSGIDKIWEKVEAIETKLFEMFK